MNWLHEPLSSSLPAPSAGPDESLTPTPPPQATPDLRPLRSLAESLTRRIVWLCVGVTLMVAGVRLIMVYKQEREAFEAAVSKVSETHLPLLANSLWDIEPLAIQHLLQDIAKAPQIQAVRLNVSTGQFFQAGEALSKAERSGEQGDITLEVPGPKGGKSLGQLSLDFNQSYLRQQLMQTFAQVGLLGLLATLGLGYLTLRILRRELHQPLQDLAHFAGTLAPGKPTPTLELARPPRPQRDELDVVVEGFRTLQGEIQHYVDERQRRAEQLEQAVARRTTELHEVTRYLETMSRRSSRFLNLAVDEYPGMIRATLRDISSHSGDCSLAIAEQPVGAPQASCRFVWLAPRDTVAGVALDQPLLADLIGPLPRGWIVLRFECLADAEPQRAIAMQRHGIQAMVCCAFTGSSGTQLLLAMSSRPEKWVFRDDRMAKMSAEMLFNIMRHWQDQLALQRLHQELEQRSNTDSLTGLANRRWFDEVKLEETRRAMRGGTSLAVVTIDVDFFKSYNDTYGHAQGDQCLVAVSRMIQQTFNRAGELPARVGGEEFTVLVPEHDLAQALGQAERLRQCVADLAIPHLGSPLQRVSISAGVSCVRPDRFEAGTSPEHFIAEALEAADGALYRAKRSGRDRVSD
ncbi:hypothetical protein DBR47_00090 [Paucibacter sp. KBW04]|uniref:sensor domain-containing diguanylate cyclase n=1 Tax=Paucibacter sp. KBW04 TaxID=2153361 RepID=UPI000F56FB7D|nr:GGDEF domain-containing protein [Paucibacter sp. KBW04]RQO63014.1 hypothetical protein DBR47_00090 [Paucibacter sp. KBW04]